MTAADFDRVCSKLNSISRNYQRTADRYQTTIEKVVKTKEICDTTKNKIERKQRIAQKTLNSSMNKIANYLEKQGF